FLFKSKPHRAFITRRAKIEHCVCWTHGKPPLVHWLRQFYAQSSTYHAPLRLALFLRFVFFKVSAIITIRKSGFEFRRGVFVPCASTSECNNKQHSPLHCGLPLREFAENI